MKIYNIKASQSQLDEFDSLMFEYNLDDEIWFEDGNTKIVTENPLAEKDIEKILTETGIEFTVE
ncbi:MAG: hypothetical protein U0K68_10895 [Agathobacter sp.]|nr:hypothetical protein [Agathobacter sp.]